MSVLERLEQFRRTPPQQELPWNVIRAIDASSFTHQPPDLRLMRNMTAFLASSDVSCLTNETDEQRVVGGTFSWADGHQLLQLMQVAIQFLLHSQNVLKEELLVKQCGNVVEKISARSMRTAETQMARLQKELIDTAAEKDLAGRSAQDLQRVLEQRNLALCLLERQLAAAHDNVSRLTAKANMHAIRCEELQRELRRTREPDKEEAVALDRISATANALDACTPVCGRRVYRAHSKHRATQLPASRRRTSEVSESGVLCWADTQRLLERRRFILDAYP